VRKKCVLILTSHYLPGFKGGGPIKSLSNLVCALGNEFDFRIITEDRDLGDDSSYVDVDFDEWNAVGKAKVFYIKTAALSSFELMRVVRNTSSGIIYLNSFFDVNYTTKVLLARRLGFLCGRRRIILAPRGEFSPGALKIKSFKKRWFISTLKLFGLYNNVLWQATSLFEKQDIINALGVEEKSVLIVKNLPSKGDVFLEVKTGHVDVSDTLKIVFLSRISPKKNLDYALKILQKVTVQVDFNIYGPKEDPEYWYACEKLIEMLPDNVNANYCGIVHPSEVSEIFAKHSIFFFPTHGENYGHVIVESLVIGTSVLLSDQTPWRNLEEKGMGWDFPLFAEHEYVQAIEHYSRTSAQERIVMREKTKDSAHRYIFNSEDIAMNRELFSTTI